jgi:hypothetical protein
VEEREGIDIGGQTYERRKERYRGEYIEGNSQRGTERGDQTEENRQKGTDREEQTVEKRPRVVTEGKTQRGET